MKPTLAQIVKSHLFDVHIESTSSPFNEKLDVLLCKGRFQLVTNNAIYSYGDLYTNYKRAFDKIDLSNFNIKNVLVLGWGLGSIPYMLEEKFKKIYHYTAVEIDEEVLYLAHKYVTQYLESSIESICSDAYAFVMHSEATYDMICMDVFVDDEVPEQFQNPAYLEQLKKMLGENGILLFNRLYLTRKDKRLTRAFFENTFLTVFPEGDYLDVGGNWIITNRRLVN
jgi:SAM-dependent methyltransferase